MKKQIPLLPFAIALAICCVMICGWKQPEFGRVEQASSGVVVLPIVKMHGYSNGCRYGEDRSIVLNVHSDGTSTINETGPILWPESRETLRQIFAARSKKVIYLTADENLRFSDYVSKVADVEADTHGMAVVMLTPKDEGRQLSDICYYSYRSDPDFAEARAAPASQNPL